MVTHKTYDVTTSMSTFNTTPHSKVSPNFAETTTSTITMSITMMTTLVRKLVICKTGQDKEQMIIDITGREFSKTPTRQHDLKKETTK